MFPASAPKTGKKGRPYFAPRFRKYHRFIEWFDVEISGRLCRSILTFLPRRGGFFQVEKFRMNLVAANAA
jgi:hypothetical protein